MPASVSSNKHHKPGGHWNDAYPFVTLHQPSAFYGVSSKELSRGKLSQHGYNKGLNELASGAEVLHYFEELMLDRFLPSGRVSYFPMCEHKGGGQFVSLLSGQKHEVQVNQRVVDSTFFGTSVPSTHTRPYSVAEAAHCIALNELPKLNRPYANYVVIGAGKTGIDAVLWLLENQVNADNITWVMPRDSWLINRRNTQPGIEFFDDSIGAQVKQMEILATVNTIPELFAELEKANILLRIDPAVTPGIFHGATVSEAELTELRRVKTILRHGRVQHVDSSELVFADTTVKVGDDAIFIDCSAIAVTARPPEPVFTDERIMIQTVRSYQPVFSAAFIAHIEASYAEDQHKNELCQVVPLPDLAGDWLRCTAAQMMNQYRWSQEPGPARLAGGKSARRF